MLIKSIKTYTKKFQLKNSYTIAYKQTSEVDNIIVVIELTNGIKGFGAASPQQEITGESLSDCQQVLNQENLTWLLDQDIRTLPKLCRMMYDKNQNSPAACAAIDIALHDLYAKQLQLPLVKVLGQVYQNMPTSITIGIKNVVDTLIEAQEYINLGFKFLKIKLGNRQDDLERIIKIREKFKDIKICVDPNQSFSLNDLNVFVQKIQKLDITFIEQPLARNDSHQLLNLDSSIRNNIAIDESLLTTHDAIHYLLPEKHCGIYNIKLMKCGGIFLAKEISTIAQASGIDLMWGCMDESRISIAAALHAAFSCPATKYLDLDGSLDIINDVARNGFTIKNGIMSPNDRPGLGIDIEEELL